MMELDLIVGSGGVLSHAPRRQQSAKLMIDSFLPEGVTSLAGDSIFMMPQLGVMANIDKKDLSEQARAAALEVFEKDCLIRLGTCIAPVGNFDGKKNILKAELEYSNGKMKEVSLDHGEIVIIDADYDEINITLLPGNGVDVGGGINEQIKTKIYGGEVGIIFDGRGRPLSLDHEPKTRISNLNKWSKAFNEYPSLEK